MARILQQGSVENKTSWPVGVEMSCPRCDCRFIIDAQDLDKKDSVLQLAMRLLPARFSMKCPECPQRLAVSQHQTDAALRNGAAVDNSGVGVGVTTYAADEP